MQERLAISRITTQIAVTLSVLLGLAFPVGYFVVSYQFLAGSLEAEAEINAGMISGVIAANPARWRFEQARLGELLARRLRGDDSRTLRILDARGMPVVENRGDVRRPMVRRSHDLLDAGARVGSIEVSRSVWPLLQRTGLATLLGLVVGLLLFWLVPYREIIRAQKKLHDAHAFLSMVMESSTNAIFVLDLAGGIRMANRRGLEMTGFCQADLVGRPFGSLFQRDALLQVNQGLAGISAGEGEDIGFETELLRSDGQAIEISLGAAPFSQDGKPAGIVLSAEDITSRKIWEQQLRHSAAKLEESNSELRNFGYTISHDMRAPLVNISGFAAELGLYVQELAAIFATQRLTDVDLLRSSALFEKEIPEALDFISGSVLRMDRLIDAILKLSRIGHLELRPEPVQLRDIVQAVLKSMSHQIEEHRATVSVGTLPQLHADRMAVEQILGNLLDNAVKYLDPKRPGELEISGESDAAGVTIHIRDNGRGIAREDQSKIFDIFTRVGRQDVQGEGMGLAYVRSLVRKLHGRIWCRSELGVGTTFSFSVPNEPRSSDSGSPGQPTGTR